MDRVLLLFSSVDGHTREMCARIAEVLAALGHDVTQQSFDDGEIPDLQGFDRVLIGASIRYGKHRPNVVDWINANAAALAARPGAFFSVNLVARKPGRDQLERNAYVQKFLKRIRWQPDRVAIFAGKLNYSLYGFWDRQAIRLIMWLTKGPTNADAVVDYTDWDRVEAFAREFSRLKCVNPHPEPT